MDVSATMDVNAMPNYYVSIVFRIVQRVVPLIMTYSLGITIVI